MDQFVLPAAYDLIAVLLFSATGAMIAAKRGYDILGVSIIAIISGGGGGIIRDAIFLNTVPVFISDWRYLALTTVGIAIVLLARSVLNLKFVGWAVLVIDAIGLGMYAVFGAQKAIGFDFTILAAIAVGTISAMGGGVLREIMMGEERKRFKPGTLYSLLALIGTIAFVGMHEGFGVQASIAAWTTIGGVFLLRLLSIKFGWHTRAVIEYHDPSEVITAKIGKLTLQFPKRRVVAKDEDPGE